MKKRLSIVDIANHLKISKTSISFILNGRAQEKRISPELVERVMKFVKEVGYKPNSLAKSLRTGKSNIIGLMVENIADPFFSNIARLIEDRAYINGYKIIYCSTDNNTEKTKDLIDMFQDRRVDGYIICPPEGIDENIADLQKQGLPVVLFDRYLPEIKTDAVIVDNEYSTYNATRHLIDQNFKNIAFITLTSGQTQMQNRMDGYQKAIKEAELKPNIKEVTLTLDVNAIIETIREYIAANKHLDAVIFGNNRIGVSGLIAINRLGLSVPGNMAVVSYDDCEVFQLHSPLITAIDQPIEIIADNIITLLLSRLHGKLKENDYQTVTIPTVLNARGSSLK